MFNEMSLEELGRYISSIIGQMTTGYISDYEYEQLEVELFHATSDYEQRLEEQAH